jgi:hypothetical protein
VCDGRDDTGVLLPGQTMFACFSWRQHFSLFLFTTEVTHPAVSLVIRLGRR